MTSSPDVSAAGAAECDAEYLIDEIARAERWHFWFQARRRLVLWAFDRYFPQAERVLDVGCGTGFILEGLQTARPGLTLAGCDPESAWFDVVRQRLPRAWLFQARAERLPLTSGVDVILALDVLEHITHDDRALGDMFTAIRPGGGLLLTVPQHPWLWSEVDDFSHHRRRYTRAALLSAVRRAGFAVMRCTSCFTLTLPLVLASRWRRGRARFDPSAEFRVPRSLNAMLLRALEVEWAAIRRGLSLPAGGSLLLAARRP